MHEVSKGEVEAYRTAILTPGKDVGGISTFSLISMRETEQHNATGMCRHATDSHSAGQEFFSQHFHFSCGVEMGDRNPAHKGCKGWKGAMFRKSQGK